MRVAVHQVFHSMFDEVVLVGKEFASETYLPVHDCLHSVSVCLLQFVLRSKVLVLHQSQDLFSLSIRSKLSEFFKFALLQVNLS